jgi:putative endonuclease
VAFVATDIRQHLGRVGERLALEHLERLGYRRVTQNHRTRFGELDLIVCDDERLVFVEVKTRRASGHAGSAVEAISPDKRRRVRAMAAAWLAETSERPRSRELRFDVIGVTVDRHGRLVRLDHVEAAF